MAELEKIGALENKQEEEVSLIVKEIHVSSSGDIVFRFNLPKEGLALRSVGIVDGMPEFRFDASYAPNVPTITEEDVATVFRLVEEGKRPEFFYLDFPPTHPLFMSRKFKQYSPTWLRGIGVGEVLAEADWHMKCLHVGTRANKEKTVFKSWAKHSKLDGLKTKLDFPRVAESGSVIMSCKGVKLQKGDNEILFPEEPKMKINAETSPLYTKYITERYQEIACQDEPTFLKVPELIKLILAVEWLYHEKGVRVSRDWMMEHTCKAGSHLELATIQNKPEPQPKICITLRPITFSVDRKKKSCKKRNPRKKKLRKKISEQPCTVENQEVVTRNLERHYGYDDFGTAETIMFDEDGVLCTHLKCQKFSVEKQSSIAHQSKSDITVRWYIPCPTALEPAKLRDALLSLQQHTSQTEITYPMPLVVDTTIDDRTDESGMEVRITRSFRPHAPQVMPPMKITTILRATVDNYDKLFANENPNTPIPGAGGEVVPNVKSWSELISELTAPVPCVFQAGVGEPIACGGVTTRNFEVEEEPLRTAIPRPLTVARAHVQATIQLVDGTEFVEVSAKFETNWSCHKGSCPQVKFVFAITNFSLRQKWMSYGQKLRKQQVESYYHGTELACNITTSKKFCTRGKCGICGISSGGLDRQCIRKDGTFQRFGFGFYLAPHSSKCNDYTRSANGYKAMLQCDVYPGQKYNLKTNDQNLTGPPHGYDSVYGQVGSKLNYPEIVVYKPHAVMPRYIIVY